MNTTTFIREASNLFTPNYLYSIDSERPEKEASKTLNRKLKAYLKSIFPDYEIGKFDGCCESSGFIKNGDKFVYISIPDLRYNMNWASRVLIRCALNEKDYRGCANHFSTIETLKEDVKRLFNRWDSELNCR